jgi:uncharacterized membrane protein (UPF0127 family)
VSAPSERWRRRLGPLPARELECGVVLHAADSLGARLLGLSGLPALPRDRGLLIPRARAVHTWGMRFELDLVWLDCGGRPVRIDVAVPPRRHRSCLDARHVVEVIAGMGEHLRIGLAA